MYNITSNYIHDTKRACMSKCANVTVAGFVFLDVCLVVCLLSMLLCLHPFQFHFVSEWMRQCKLDAHAWVLPYLLVVIIILIVGLQLNWMFLVSLHHLHAAARLDCEDAYKYIRHTHLEETRTRMLKKIICKTPHKTCGEGHSDEAFMACLAAALGIVAVVYFDWTSAQHWLHFYGVFLFCSGFFVTLQIIWWNLQKACSVASLRNMKLVSGMHWALDTAIILFFFVFLTFNYALGQTGAAVVSSELIAFALLLLQFLYVFQVCCWSAPPHLPTRACYFWGRFWFCLLICAPFLLVTIS